MVTKTKASAKSKSAAKSKNQSITVADISQRIEHHLQFTMGEHSNANQKPAYWRATSLALNDIIVEKLQSTKARQSKSEVKSVNYLSLEYLMGRLLSNNLHNLGLYTNTEKALTKNGL